MKRTPAKQAAMEKQSEKRKGHYQCNLSYVKHEFTALLAEMMTGYSSKEACLHDALIALKSNKIHKSQTFRGLAT